MVEAGSVTVDVTKMSELRRDEILGAMTAPLTAFYADPQNQAKFQEWLAKRKQKKGGS